LWRKARRCVGLEVASVERHNLAPQESTVVHVYMDARRFTGQKTLQKVALRIQPAQAGMFRYEIKIKTDLLDAPMMVEIDGVAAP
jgi:hypothetical protein